MTPAGAATTLCELVPLFEAEACGNRALTLSLEGRDAMRSTLSTPAGAAITLCDDIGTPATEFTKNVSNKRKFNGPLAKITFAAARFGLQSLRRQPQQLTNLICICAHVSGRIMRAYARDE